MYDRSAAAIDVATWTFFERTEEPDLWCAIPATTSMPRFLFSGHWRFSGQEYVCDGLPRGFRLDVAIEAEELNGFYLFQRVPDATIEPAN